MGCCVQLITHYFPVFQFKDYHDDDDNNDGSEIINESVINVVVTGAGNMEIEIPEETDIATLDNYNLYYIVPTTVPLGSNGRNSIRPSLIWGNKNHISCQFLNKFSFSQIRIASEVNNNAGAYVSVL